MLSKPNVKEILPKVGNRYEAAVAIAKRARDIEKRRVMEGDNDITDAVDIAAKEIAEEDVLVKKDGKLVIDPDEKIKKEIIEKNIIDDEEELEGK